MAKLFYTAEEAAQKLGKSEEELKGLVREGTLREFRDGDSVNYKVDDVDKMAAASTETKEDSTAASASASGEIVLEPVDDSSVSMSPSGSDILNLEDLAEGGSGDTGDTAAGTQAAGDSGERKKSDSVVPSVGVNVFDDDELDEAVDPLAQTAVTDVAGLGMDSAGSGSGILDLSRESDDTSLGAELLEEIYTGEEEGEGGDKEAPGEDTRAGIDEVASEAVAEDVDEDIAAGLDVETAPQPRAAVRQVVEYGPDTVSTSLTAAMVVAVVVMWIAGLAGAAMVRGVFPGILKAVYANLMIYAGGALGVAVLAAAVTYLVAKRSE